AQVEVLAGFSPAPAQRLDYLIALAEGRHTLIVRLITDQQVEAAAALTTQAVTDYRTHAAEPGADRKAARAARRGGAGHAERGGGEGGESGGVPGPSKPGSRCWPGSAPPRRSGWTT